MIFQMESEIFQRKARTSAGATGARFSICRSAGLPPAERRPGRTQPDRTPSCRLQVGDTAGWKICATMNRHCARNLRTSGPRSGLERARGYSKRPGRPPSHFGAAPAMAKLRSISSETLSSIWPPLMPKSRRLMTKWERKTRRSPSLKLRSLRRPLR